jgi:hypothetical protein
MSKSQFHQKFDLTFCSQLLLLLYNTIYVCPHRNYYFLFVTLYSIVCLNSCNMTFDGLFNFFFLLKNYLCLEYNVLLFRSDFTFYVRFFHFSHKNDF